MPGRPAGPFTFGISGLTGVGSFAVDPETAPIVAGGVLRWPPGRRDGSLGLVRASVGDCLMAGSPGLIFRLGDVVPAMGAGFWPFPPTCGTRITGG